MSLAAAIVDVDIGFTVLDLSKSTNDTVQDHSDTNSSGEVAIGVPH
jgi:hypothetical protein